MLSSSKQTTASSAQQQRQRLHRRQNSTPALEAGHLPPLPAIVQRQRSHRRGRSMDQKPTYLNAGPPSPTGTINTANGKTVSITNTGHNDLQHPMQIAQQHGLHQPGPQLSPGFPFRDQGFSFPPRSPPILEETSDNRLPSPQRQPSELDIKNLEQHVKALYGENHTVVVNILPSPTPSPRKPNQTRPLASVDHAPMPPPQFSSDLGSDLQLDPLIMSPQSRNFRFQTPEHEFKYDSYESPDQLSPQQSPTYSPMQTPCKSAFSDKGFNGPKLTFPEGSAVLPTTQAMNSLTLSSPISPTFDSPDITMQSNPGMDPMTPEVEIPPDVQAQIEALVSEPDPTTSQRRCLFPGCTKDPFNRKENALSHVQGHLKWRPYVCNVCNKDFVRPHDLKRHVKIHSDHKPHVCPCGLAFTRADALSRHRSRAVCVGSYPGAVRSQNKRGRPKKRPGIESRVEKANKTRRAIASKGDQSSTSGYSPVSSGPASPGAEDCSQQSSSPASKNAQLHSQAGRFAPVADTAQFASAEQPTFMTSADLTRSESQFSQLSHYSQYSNYSSQPQQQQQQQASQEADRAEEAKWKVQLQMWDSQGSAGFSPETFMTTSSNFHAALQPDIAGSPSDEIFSLDELPSFTTAHAVNLSSDTSTPGLTRTSSSAGHDIDAGALATLANKHTPAGTGGAAPAKDYTQTPPSSPPVHFATVDPTSMTKSPSTAATAACSSAKPSPPAPSSSSETATQPQPQPQQSQAQAQTKPPAAPTTPPVSSPETDDEFLDNLLDCSGGAGAQHWPDTVVDVADFGDEFAGFEEGESEAAFWLGESTGEGMVAGGF